VRSMTVSPCVVSMFHTGVTAFYGDPLPDDKAMELFKTVYDSGCCHFDTAEIYKTGNLYNKGVLGKFLATAPRDSYSVATKYWPSTDDYAYKAVKPRLEASLNRLDLAFVDLYYAHRPSQVLRGRSRVLLYSQALAGGRSRERGWSL